MSDWESNDSCGNAVQTNCASGFTRNGRNPRQASYNCQRDFGKRQLEGKRKERVKNCFKETIDVRDEHIGMIIGKSGSNIQRLENNYNVRVDLNKKNHQVTVYGKCENDVKRALEDVRIHINKYGTRSGSDGSRREFGDNSYRNGGNARKDCYTNTGEKSDLYNDFYFCNDEISSGDCGGESFANNDNESNDSLIDWKSLNERAENARKERWAKCPPLTKNFYLEVPEVANLRAEEVNRIRSQNKNTTVQRLFRNSDGSADDIPNPIWKFEQCFASYPDLLAEIKKQDFQKPSPIQSQAWPILLKGEDMIGIAQTGTGKTLAFLLPAMIHTEYQSTPRSQRGGPNVLVLAPTRELALQIEKEVNKYQFRNMKA